MYSDPLCPASVSPVFEPLEPRLLLDAQADAVQLFSASPALFVENQGQWADPSVRYVHQGDGATVAMTDAGPVFQVYRQVPREGAPNWPEVGPDLPPGLNLPDAAAYNTQALQFSATFVGANTVAPIGEAQSAAQFNYFVGDQGQWRSEVPAYEKVAYDGLYSGVDLVTQGLRSHLKYEFHVAPGADPSVIAVHYDGIQGLSLAEDGSLRVDLGGDWGQVADDAPVIYQDIGGQRTEVAGRFVLLDDRTYSFQITGAYDPTQELVIDPDLAWFSYLPNCQPLLGIAVDTGGSTYVAGDTDYRGLGTPGAYDRILDDYCEDDAFVAKFNATGSALVYFTYLGGDGHDEGRAIAVDSDGNAYVTGWTHSSGLATAGAYDTTYGGGGIGQWSGNAFVAKFNATGSVLVYFTYLGGEGGGWGTTKARASPLTPAGTHTLRARLVPPAWQLPGRMTRLGALTTTDMTPSWRNSTPRGAV